MELTFVVDIKGWGVNFTAIDVETANADFSSICQIGLAVVRNGEMRDVITEIIDPEDYFDPVNTSIHGITKADVAGRPTFQDFLPVMECVVKEHPLVSHTLFDRTAVSRACEKYGCPPTCNPWLDSAIVARRCWPEQFGSSGYGLKNIAKVFGIEFRHHDAGEDARVAAEILLRAGATGTFELGNWVANGPPQRSRSSYQPYIKLDGNPDGPMYGLQVVFTGQLCVPRAEAAMRAADLGLFVHPSVTKKTSLVVVGNEDIRRPEWGEKSAKHRKAEELIEKGFDILILSERDFFALIDMHTRVEAHEVS